MTDLSDVDLKIPVSRGVKFSAFVLAIAVAVSCAILVGTFNKEVSPSADASQMQSTDVLPWSTEEVAAADKEMWNQLSSGWVAYGSYEATTHESVRGWIHLRANPDAIDFDLVRSQTAANFGGLPVYDAPNGQKIGIHFSMVGFVPLADADRFDQAAARLAAHGCDASSTNPAEARSCMDRLVSNEGSKRDSVMASSIDGLK